MTPRQRVNVSTWSSTVTWTHALLSPWLLSIFFVHRPLKTPWRTRWSGKVWSRPLAAPHSIGPLGRVWWRGWTEDQQAETKSIYINFKSRTWRGKSKGFKKIYLFLFPAKCWKLNQVPRPSFKKALWKNCSKIKKKSTKKKIRIKLIRQRYRRNVH